MSWERSFVAMTFLVSEGASVDDAAKALADDSAGRAGDVIARLRDPKRAVRAAALAEVAKDVAIAIDEVALR
jgi:hypothetical protein